MEENIIQQSQRVSDDSATETQNNLPTKSISTNLISAAFMLIFIGFILFQIPIDSWNIKIMWITAWIAILTGSVQLFRLLEGNGKKAALLWISATIFSIIAIPFEVLHSFTQGLAKLSEDIGNVPITENFQTLNSLLKYFLTLGTLMYIGGIILFMNYPPLTRLKTGWIWLLLAFTLSVFKQYSIFTPFLLFIGFYLIIIQIADNSDQTRHRIGALIWMAVGSFYSFLILQNNDTIYIIISFIGLVAWLIGVIKVRTTENGNRGTEAFIAYAILMILASVLHLLPSLIGDGLAILFQIPAYIILTVGFIRFSKGNHFARAYNGMHTMGYITCICIILALIYLIPLIGENISAMIFCLLCTPCITVAWKNAVTALPDSIIDLSPSTKRINTNWIEIITKHKKTGIALIFLFTLLLIAGNINTDKYAENWLSKANTLASEAGHVAEIANPENFEIAQLVKKAARLGNSEAKLYADKLTTKDLQQIYNKAENGNSYAQYAIGFLFRFSSPILRKMKDEERKDAQKWLQKHMAFSTLEQYRWFNAAAKQGHPRAQYLIDNAYQKEKEESLLFEQYLKSANEGNASAQNTIGECYAKGEGVEWNISQAINWWRKAAQNGNAKAQVHMGNAYEHRYYHDDTTPYNGKEATKWYRMAAEQNNAEALYEMAKHTKDRNESIQWLKKAAEKGYQKAIYELKHTRY